MKVKVHVTENDIKCGIRGDTGACMIHRALERIVLKNTFFSVTSEMVCFNDGRILDMDESTEKKIVNWDLGENIPPFTFKIDIPARYLDFERQNRLVLSKSLIGMPDVFKVSSGFGDRTSR
jgi:hypothetical protein